VTVDQAAPTNRRRIKASARDESLDRSLGNTPIRGGLGNAEPWPSITAAATQLADRRLNPPVYFGGN